MAGIRDLRPVRLLGQQAPADANEREAELDERAHRGEGAGDGEIENLAVAVVVAHVFGAACDHFDVNPEPGRGLDEERSLVLVGLDQSDLEVRPLELQGQPGQAAARPDVDQPARVAEVVEQDERVVDQLAGRPGDQARPLLDHPRELTQLRIQH